jgi:hypothetical protein
MNGYILFSAISGYLLDPVDETFTKLSEQAYVFYDHDEAKNVAEYWYGAEVIPVHREEK